jgi:hypothetical protein
MGGGHQDREGHEDLQEEKTIVFVTTREAWQ